MVLELLVKIDRCGSAYIATMVDHLTSFFTSLVDHTWPIIRRALGAESDNARCILESECEANDELRSLYKNIDMNTSEAGRKENNSMSSDFIMVLQIVLNDPCG